MNAQPPGKQTRVARVDPARRGGPARVVVLGAVPALALATTAAAQAPAPLVERAEYQLKVGAISAGSGTMEVLGNSPMEYATVLAGAGVPEPFAHAIAAYDVATAHGALFDDSRQLSALIGRPTTPRSVTVGEVLRAQAG